MKVLIFSVIFIASQAGAQDLADKYIDCALVKCAPPVPPVCPPGTVLTKLSSPRPGRCCNPYECKQDCTFVKCGRPMPVSCPADSVLIKGITLPGQCCPRPGRCECNPAGCVRKKCPRGYLSVLVSKGSGKPGNCCNVYKCKREIDCSSVMCPAVVPPPCLRGAKLVKRNTLIPGDCCNIYECRPEIDCATIRCARPEPPVCPPGTILIDHDIPRPWDCCNPYECITDIIA